MDLTKKIRFMLDVYNKEVVKHKGMIDKKNVKNVVNYCIKWTRAVKNDLFNGKKYSFNRNLNP